jgi:peptide/nickel transport system substrate-binding protein
MEQGAAESDQSKRVAIYQKLQDVLAEELPWAPYFAWNLPIGRKSTLQGFKVNSYSDTNAWNAAEWSWG